ncbi:MAG: SulP family inorganic anion transporter [Myxococcota bacterium]
MTAQSVFREGMASIVVLLVALPLCMGVAIASGVPPAMGLISGIVGGIVVGALAGSPLQVSGPAAGLAVIVYEIVQTHGIEMLGPIVLVAGVVQLAAGRLGVAPWFRAVAPAVIYGMLAGIGILIFASQFHVMIDDKPVSSGLANLIAIPGAIVKGVSGSEHRAAAAIGVLTLIVLVVWNGIRNRLPGGLSALPAPLLAVAAAVAAAAAFGLNIAYVTIPDGFANLFSFPTFETLGRLTEPSVIGSALALAAIASAEALLCAVAVDKLHTGVRTDLDRELFAQGVGNAVVGFLGGLPVTGVIVRSSANVASGAQTRWSAVMHGIWLLIAVAMVPFALTWIPVASLAAVLVYIGWKLVNPEIVRGFLARGKAELGIYVATVGAIVATDLLTGLLVGIGLSFLKLAWSFSHLDIDVRSPEVPEGRIDVHMAGSGTFVVLPKLARTLQELPAEREVHIHLEDVDYVDHACFELLSDWRKQYESRGGEVVVEWDTLAARGIYRGRETEAA